MKKKLKILSLTIAGLAVLAGLAVYLSFFTNLWRYYPNPFRAQTALSRLEMSAISEPVCHEDCFARRQLYQNIISDYALGYPEMRQQIKKLILDPSAYPEFQAELVSVLKKTADKEKAKSQAEKITIPDFLFTYLNDPKGQRPVKERILAEFGGQGDNRLRQYLYDIAANRNLSDIDRAQTINVLGNVGNAEALEFLMEIVEDKTNSNSLRYIAAWKMPGLIGYNHIKLSKSIVDRAAKIVLDKSDNPYVRDDLLGVIYNYKDIDRNYVEQIIKQVYNTTDNKYIKDTAANMLNGLTGTDKYKSPEISSKEWDKQWNDTDKLLAPLFQDLKDMVNQNKK